LFTLFHFNLRIYCLFFINYFLKNKNKVKRRSKRKKNSLNKVYLSMFRNNNNSKWMSLLLLIIAISSLHFWILILWAVQKYLGLKIIHFLALLIYVIVFQFGYLLFVLLVSYFITFSFLTLNQKSRSKWNK